MSTQTLTIVGIEPRGAVLRLSDGKRYQVQDDHHSISSHWNTGELLIVTLKHQPPNSFELRSALRTSEVVRSVRT